MNRNSLPAWWRSFLNLKFCYCWSKRCGAVQRFLVKKTLIFEFYFLFRINLSLVTEGPNYTIDFEMKTNSCTNPCTNRPCTISSSCFTGADRSVYVSLTIGLSPEVRGPKTFSSMLNMGLKSLEALPK